MSEEIDIKHSRIKKLLASRKLSGLLLAKQSNLHWFTGGKMNDVIKNEDISLIYIYITKDKKYLLATSSDIDRMMEEELAGLDFEQVLYNWYDQSPLDALSKVNKLSAIGADISLPETIPLEAEISYIRRNLTGHEIKRFKKLAEDYTKTVTEFCRDITLYTLYPDIGWDEFLHLFEKVHSVFCGKRIIIPSLPHIMENGPFNNKGWIDLEHVRTVLRIVEDSSE